MPSRLRFAKRSSIRAGLLLAAAFFAALAAALYAVSGVTLLGAARLIAAIAALALAAAYLILAQRDRHRAIEKVAAGEGYVDPALMPAFLSGKDKDDMLTGREREILQLLADGMSNADVASKLFISQETVKSHVRHILAKLEADTRTHAVAIALREAIID